MKRSLVFKLTLCYIIAISLFYAVANTLGSNYIEDFLMTYELNNMRKDASTIIKSEKLKEYYNGEISLEELNAFVSDVSNVISSQIWILNTTGTILIDSSNMITGTNNVDITSYSPELLNKQCDKNLYIPSLMSEPCISSVNSVKNDDGLLCYVVLNLPLETISSEFAVPITALNILLLLFCPILAGIFVLIYFLTIAPVHKITKYAIEYSKGHFDYKLNITSNDEYKKLADAITYMAGELNNLDDYQRKFISNISHDFRSPLTSIKGYVEAMLDGTIPTSNQEKYLNIILFETDRLTDLTANLLTLNKFGNNMHLLDKKTFDINYIIKKTMDTYEGRCNKNKITLVYDFESPTQFVYADQSQIQQVINNLIDNAIKFSHANSEILLSTCVRNEKIFVSVKDSGSGIPKNSINKIWERFYKIDPSRGKDKKGTGLGLAITKEIINAHNENINVISTEGVGSEFIFTLSKPNAYKGDV